MRSAEIVIAFWDDVWNAHQPDAVDRFVTDDVVIEAGGQEISGKDNVKNWVKEFLDHVNDLHVDAIETFQNDDGTHHCDEGHISHKLYGIAQTLFSMQQNRFPADILCAKPRMLCEIALIGQTGSGFPAPLIFCPACLKIAHRERSEG